MGTQDHWRRPKTRWKSIVEKERLEIWQRKYKKEVDREKCCVQGVSQLCNQTHSSRTTCISHIVHVLACLTTWWRCKYAENTHRPKNISWKRHRSIKHQQRVNTATKAEMKQKETTQCRPTKNVCFLLQYNENNVNTSRFTWSWIH